MNILLNSIFGKSIIGRIIEKKIKQATGCDIKIDVNDLTISHTDSGPVVLHLDIKGEMNEADVKKLIGNI